MSPPSYRNTCKNAINKEPIDPMVTAKNKPEPKSPVISYDYDAAISQPDIPIYSKIDNDTPNASCLEFSDEWSAPTMNRNCYARGKASVATKKRGTVFKSKTQAKKNTKTRLTTCDVAEIKKELMSSSKIIRDVENFGPENSDGIRESRETPPHLHQVRPDKIFPLDLSLDNFAINLCNIQKDLAHSRDVQKPSGIAENDRTFASKTADVSQENSDKIDKDTRSCITQNKTSKIPRIKPSIKPNSFLSVHGESRAYPSTKLSVRNELKCFTDMKSSADNEEGKSIFVKSGSSSNKETLNAVDYQKLKTKNILQTVHENSNLRCPEKSSEMDADEEFEGDLPTPTKESPITTGADDDPRSATLLKSLALKCECHSCNNHKYASTVRTGQHPETESWSSPETESARKCRDSTRHRKFIDASSEDMDLSDYNNVVNYSNGKTNRKNNGISNFADYIEKPTSTINYTKMKTYRRTSFSFFNVFFDIVFWPFVLLRAKQ